MGEAEIDDVASRLRLACMRIARRARAESKDTIPQAYYAVLTELENGPLTAAVLAARENVSPPIMTRNINALEELGYVHRTRDAGDRRQILISLSERGDRVRTEIRKDRDAWMARSLRALTPEQLRTLAEATELLEDIEQA